MRSAATVLTAFLLLLLQSTVLELAPTHLVAPSLGLIVVLHVGLSSRWNVGSAAMLAFAIGYLFDLVSGAPRGVYGFTFVVMALFARLVSTRVVVRGVVLTAATAFVASLVAAAIVVVLRALVAADGEYAGLREAPIEALLTGVCAPPVLWLLARIDGRLDPERLRVGLARRRARRLASAPGPR